MNWIDVISPGILLNAQLVVVGPVPYYTVPSRKMTVRINTGGFVFHSNLDWTMKYSSNSPGYAVWLASLQLALPMTGKINSCQITLAPPYDISSLGYNPFVATVNNSIPALSFPEKCALLAVTE